MIFVYGWDRAAAEESLFCSGTASSACRPNGGLMILVSCLEYGPEGATPLVSILRFPDPADSSPGAMEIILDSGRTLRVAWDALEGSLST